MSGGSAPQRIGVYGGTFDPIHETHLAIARAALTQAGLDRVLFVVAAQPPHKRHAVHASAADRFALVEAALADTGEPRFATSRIEIDRAGPSYTVDTLRELQEALPGATLFLILGADALADLPKWRDPEGIVARAKLLVVPRPGFDPRDIPLSAQVDVLNFEAVTDSSTEVRARLAAGGAVDDALTNSTAALIRARGLYRGTVAGNA